MIKRPLVAIHSLLFTRGRADLRDIVGFRADAAPEPRGVKITVSGVLVESSKTVIAVKAEPRQDSIELSVITRGIAVSGPANRGTFREAIPVSLPRHGSFKLLYINHDLTKEKVGTVVW